MKESESEALDEARSILSGDHPSSKGIHRLAEEDRAVYEALRLR